MRGEEHITASLKCPRASFNPKPEAMAGATSERSIPLPAIASGFGLNEEDPSWRRHTCRSRLHRDH